MEKLEKEKQIRECFDFYQKEVLPKVEELATQKKDGYHGLYTHTDSVVFRAIDYALELSENPIPALFAAACHDMARTHDSYDEQHGTNAVPFAKQVMTKFPKKLTNEEQSAVLYAIQYHTIGKNAPDYVSACLWDADRTRLAWERGYHEKFFNTDYAKKVASGDPNEYLTWQNKVLGRPNEDRESIQAISAKTIQDDLLKILNQLKKNPKQ